MDSDDRPAVVDERSRIGDWAGDTVMDKGCQSALLTLVERKTRYTRVVRLTGKRAVLLTRAVPRGMRDIADQVKAVIFDNGLEFAEHEQIAFGLDADVYLPILMRPGNGVLTRTPTVEYGSISLTGQTVTN